MDYSQMLAELVEDDSPSTRDRLAALRQAQFGGLMSMVPDLPGVQRAGAAMVNQTSRELDDLTDPSAKLDRLTKSMALAKAQMPEHIEDGWFQMPDGSIVQHPGMAAGTGGAGSLGPWEDFKDLAGQEGKIFAKYEPAYNEFQGALQARNMILEALENPGAISSYASLQQIGKLLDPTSAVMEGELAAIRNNAQSAWSNLVVNLESLISNKGRITPEAKAQIAQLVDRLTRVKAEIAQDKYDRYAGMITDYYGNPTRALGARPELTEYSPGVAEAPGESAAWDEL